MKMMKAKMSLALSLTIGLAFNTGIFASPQSNDSANLTDRFGDALPEGSWARLGTVRFRQGFFLYRAVYSPDGKTIACAAAGRGLCLWDAATGKLLRRIGQATHANAVAFSPNGKLLMSQDKGTPALFETATGRLLGPLPGAAGGVAAVAFAPDGKGVAVARYNGGFGVWDVDESAKTRKRFDKAEPSTRCLAFSPDGKWLATGGEDRIVYLWDTTGGEERGKLMGHEKEISSVVFCPDSNTLVSASNESSICFWDVKRRKSLRAVDGKHDTVTTVAATRDGKTLASGHGDGTIALWNARTGEAIRHWRAHYARLTTLDFAPDGATLVSGTVWGSGPQLWEVAAGKEKNPIEGHCTPVDHLAFSSDGRNVLSIERDGLSLRWDLSGERRCVRSERPIWATYGHGCAISPTGGTAATWAYKDDLIRLWDMATNKELHALGTFKDDQQRGRVFPSLSFSADGKLLAFAGTKERVAIVWDAASGKELRRYTGFPNRISCVALSPNGTRIAVGSESANGTETIAAWDVTSGKKGVTYSSVQPVHHLLFSPDGRVLASGHWNGPAHLWDVDTGRELRPLSVAASVNGLAFSADGKWLAGAGADYDQKIHVWEVMTGQEVYVWSGHISGAMAVAFATDGRILASGGADSTILLWDVTGRSKEGRLCPARWKPSELEQRWKELASFVAPKATRAIWDLVADPEQTVALLRQRLKPIESVPSARLERLLRDLNDDSFETRSKATEELEQIVDAAAPALRKRLTEKPTLEVRRRIQQILAKLEPSSSTERLRALRAIQVLEYSGTPEAKKCLETVASGLAEARSTQEAKAALARLAARPDLKP